jgi:chromosome partitioning protein
MKTITLAHQKGGVGKTTLAINLAFCFASDAKVAITDADLQGSINGLQQLIIGIDLVSTQRVLDQTLTGYDLLIVDTPPYLSSDLPRLFALSDYVLIPTRPGFLDVMAIKASIDLIQKSQQLKPGLQAGIVLNAVQARTAITAEVSQLLATYPIPLLPTQVHHRVSYTRSVIMNGIFESNDQRAKQEIQALATDILTQLTSHE